MSTEKRQSLKRTAEYVEEDESLSSIIEPLGSDDLESEEFRPRKRLRRAKDVTSRSGSDVDNVGGDDDEESSGMDSFIVSDFSDDSNSSDEMDASDESSGSEEQDDTAVHPRGTNILVERQERQEKKSQALQQLLDEVADIEEGWGSCFEDEMMLEVEDPGGLAIGSHVAIDDRDDIDVDSAKLEDPKTSTVRTKASNIGDEIFGIGEIDEEWSDSDATDVEIEWRAFIKEKDAKRVRSLADQAKKDLAIRTKLAQLDIQTRSERAKRASLPDESFEARMQRGAERLGMLPLPNNRNGLFLHQIVGLAWVMLREAVPFKGNYGGIIADEMGLGKTLLSLSIVAMDRISGYASNVRPHDGKRGSSSDKAVATPTLILCPNSLIPTWMSEIDTRLDPRKHDCIVLKDEYCPGWREQLYAKDLANRDIILINYDGLRNLYKGLRNELINHIRRFPKLYEKYMDDPDFVADADEGNDEDDKNVEPVMHDSLASDDDDDDDVDDAITIQRKKEAEFDRKINKLISKDLSVGFKVLWKNTKRWRAAHFIFGVTMRRVIMDEATTFKNDSALVFRAVRAVRAGIRWSLSGTPLENNMDELYSQFVILGLANTMQTIRDKAAWHRLITSGGSIESESGGSNSFAPDASVVSRLKRRALNVLTMRREVHNLNAINPLLPYVLRATANESDVKAWNLIIKTRHNAKLKRSLSRASEKQMRRKPDELRFEIIMDTGPDESDSKRALFCDTNSPLNVQMEAAIPEAVAERTVRHPNIPEGFYWYTRNQVLTRAVEDVDRWLMSAFGVTIGKLSDTIEDVRRWMRTVPPERLVDEYHTHIEERSIDALSRNLGIDPETIKKHIKVLEGFRLPAPLVFVADMHALEKAAYENALQAGGRLTTQDSEAAASDTESAHNVAFRCVTQCRAICADYRTAGNAPFFLPKTRGILWDVDGNEPTVSVSLSAFGKSVRDQFEESLEPQVSIDGQDIPESGSAAIDVPMRLPTKFLMLLRYIKAMPPDDKIVLFTDLIAFVDELKNFLEQYGIHTIVVYGRMSMVERDAALSRFGKRKARVLIASLKCLSLGINLTVANHAGFIIDWWNGAIEEQAKRRIMRAMQKKQVYFIYFIISNTIEELVIARGGEKSEMITSVIGGGDDIVTTGSNFSRPDIETAYVMTFEQGPHGPIIPSGGSWGEQTLDDLRALPVRALGRRFEDVTFGTISTDRGKIDRTKLVRTLVACNDRRQ